ncbi:MAG: Nif3-like dinuclear metal center hexameric protein [Candidatus Limivivens sp.]|nr:Nif3-like dinuclear metal center hexameric protein [Candidatus Limivivens sp.]
MKIREVIERVLEYHPKFPEDYQGCDNYKCGDPEAECTGIVTALVPTVEVIRKAIEVGANLLFVHEPSFYSTPDYPDWRADFRNEVYEEKRKLLDEHGIVIWRDHDHMHAHQPDSIFTGVTKYLGWEAYAEGKIGMFTYKYRLPECTVEELKQELIDKLHLNGLRYMGDPKAKISRVGIVGHLCPNAFGTDHVDENGYFVEYATEVTRALEQELDAIIPGEIIEWTTLSYLRDAIQLGKNKAMFNIGHFSMEELGMRYAQDWITELTEGQVPVTYVPSGDMYQY